MSTRSVARRRGWLGAVVRLLTATLVVTASTYASAEPVRVGIPPACVAPLGEFEVPIVLENDVPMRALTLRIRDVPDEFELVSGGCTLRTSGFSCQPSEVPNANRINIVIVDLGGRTISPGDGPVMMLRLRDRAPACVPPATVSLVVSDVVAADARSNPLDVVSEDGTITCGCCGNGRLDPEEECDPRVPSSACCTEECRYAAADIICRASAGNCDVAETCSGTGAICPPDGRAPDGTACSDGVFCNGDEVCRGGACSGGAQPCPPASCSEEDRACATTTTTSSSTSSTTSTSTSTSTSSTSPSTSSTSSSTSTTTSSSSSTTSTSTSTSSTTTTTASTSSTTSTSTSTSTTSTLSEVCDDCSDNDGDGAIDLADPACPSTQLTLAKAAIRPGRREGSNRVTARATVSGFLADIMDGIRLTVRSDAGGLLPCENIPASNFRVKAGRRRIRFERRGPTTQIASLVLTTRQPNGPTSIRMKLRGVEVPNGTMQLEVLMWARGTGFVGSVQLRRRRGQLIYP